jgi:hypothetical protein
VHEAFGEEEPRALNIECMKPLANNEKPQTLHIECMKFLVGTKRIVGIKSSSKSWTRFLLWRGKGVGLRAYVGFGARPLVNLEVNDEGT